MWLVGTLWLILATGVQTANRTCFLEQLMPNGVGPPAHYHPLAIEAFYVIEGNLKFYVDGAIYTAGPGSLVHIPRMAPHTFTVDSKEARVLNWYSPAGSELHVISLARPADERRLPTFAEGPPPQTAEQNLILSRLYGSVGVEALPFSVPPEEALLHAPKAAWTVGDVQVTLEEDAPTTLGFGVGWRFLARGRDTSGTYDLAAVEVSDASKLPSRLLGADEAIYVLEGIIVADADGVRHVLRPGAFLYAPSGTALSWSAEGQGRALVWHFPSGFDDAVDRGMGEEALINGWLEASGTRLI